MAEDSDERERVEPSTGHDDPLVGQTIAERWLILERLGEGGMSVVYKAKHLIMDKIVAIKSIRSDLVSNAKLVQRFQQEARTAAALRHPNLMAVQDCLVTRDGRAYLIMDFVDGESLSDMLARARRLSPAKAATILLQAADAISYAHSQHVLHRDIKPSNIMIERSSAANDKEESSEIRIVDFGIAKLLASEEGEQIALTQTGEVFGSPPYMSPEQIAGAVVDARSDIYSLGCVMYETLTGQPPFRGNTILDTMMKHSSDIPRTFTEVLGAQMVKDDALLRRLEVVTMKALEKRPEDRFQSMKEVSQAILKAVTASGGWSNDEFKGILRRRRLLFNRQFVWTKLTVFILALTFLFSGLSVWLIWGWNRTQSYDVILGMISTPMKKKINSPPVNYIRTEATNNAIYKTAEESGGSLDDAAQACQVLGMLYSSTGKYEKAREMYEKSVEYWKKVTPNVVNIAEIEGDLCYVYYAMGDMVQARRAALDTLRRVKTAAPSNSPFEMVATFVLAEIYMDEAHEWVKKERAKIDDLRAAQKNDASKKTQMEMYEIADGYKDKAKIAFNFAIQHFTRAFRGLERKEGEYAILRGKIALRLADAYAMSGDKANAEQYYDAAIGFFQTDPELVAKCYFSIGHLELMQSRFESANIALDRALTQAQSLSPRNQPLLCMIKKDYSDSLWNTNPIKSVLMRYSMLQDMGN